METTSTSNERGRNRDYKYTAEMIEKDSNMRINPRNSGYVLFYFFNKPFRENGNPVADGWAGAVSQKPLGIQKCNRRTDGRTHGPTDTARCRVAYPRLKVVFPDFEWSMKLHIKLIDGGKTCSSKKQARPGKDA